MGMDGIAHHVRARSPINLRPTHRAAGIQIQLQLAGKGHISKLDHTLSILQTSYSSTLRGPQRQVVWLIPTVRIKFPRPKIRK